MPEQILTMADVLQFIGHLYDVERVCFHPDDPFEDYIDKEKNATYTPEEASLRDSLMEQAFDVCDTRKIDLYAVCNLMYRIRFLESFQ
ncbi:hypothetical protein [Spirosoma fluviale]|uniref:Uncharacterized protein n=1 Tax=Spirosoma fluviale TaxID=1597977 RepID=A0A286FD14_9BACT|nr:hypothetical protein [Spirosoma fluviale]SOD80869.1 hypothetical protein SAMN06269250_1594 [Spirosoma fluviale]